MKDESMLKLKSIFKLALLLYFELSGINLILLQLYQASKLAPKKPEVKKTTQVLNILKKNANAINKRAEKKPSRLSSLKQAGMSLLMMSYLDEELLYNGTTPMLNAIRLSTNYDDIPQGSISSRVVMNENIDPITTGMSVLDSSLPNFLKQGLRKIANK